MEKRTRTTYGPDKDVAKNEYGQKMPTGKVNHYLCKITDRSLKLGQTLTIIKKEKGATNYQLCNGLCGNGTMSEILNGKCGATDEFFAKAMHNIGMSYGDLLRKAGLFDKIASV